MATGMVSLPLWSLQTVTKTGGTSVSPEIDISKANAIALHLQTVTGTAPDVTFTYSMSSTKGGTYVTPASPVTIKANAAAADVLDFAPEAGRFIKITATNNNAGNDVVISALIAIQELG